MAKGIFPQPHPRVQDENDKFHGFLDETTWVEQTECIGVQQVKAIIAQVIRQANAKSSRQILDISPDLVEAETKKNYKHEGKKLFEYFIKNYFDAPEAALVCQGMHYSVVADEEFRKYISQKQEMNIDYCNRIFLKDPVISKYSCKERANLIYAVLVETQSPTKIPINNQIIETFGKACRKYRLVDKNGCFNDPKKLLSLFCS